MQADGQFLLATKQTFVRKFPNFQPFNFAILKDTTLKIDHITNFKVVTPAVPMHASYRTSKFKIPLT